MVENLSNNTIPSALFLLCYSTTREKFTCSWKHILNTLCILYSLNGGHPLRVGKTVGLYKLASWQFVIEL